MKPYNPERYDENYVLENARAKQEYAAFYAGIAGSDTKIKKKVRKTTAPKASGDWWDRWRAQNHVQAMVSRPASGSALRPARQNKEVACSEKSDTVGPGGRNAIEQELARRYRHTEQILTSRLKDICLELRDQEEAQKKEEGTDQDARSSDRGSSDNPSRSRDAGRSGMMQQKQRPSWHRHVQAHNKPNIPQKPHQQKCHLKETNNPPPQKPQQPQQESVQPQLPQQQQQQQQQQPHEDGPKWELGGDVDAAGVQGQGGGEDGEVDEGGVAVEQQQQQQQVEVDAARLDGIHRNFRFLLSHAEWEERVRWRNKLRAATAEGGGGGAGREGGGMSHEQWAQRDALKRAHQRALKQKQDEAAALEEASKEERRQSIRAAAAAAAKAKAAAGAEQKRRASREQARQRELKEEEEQQNKANRSARIEQQREQVRRREQASKTKQRARLALQEQQRVDARSRRWAKKPMVLAYSTALPLHVKQSIRKVLGTEGAAPTTRAAASSATTSSSTTTTSRGERAPHEVHGKQQPPDNNHKVIIGRKDEKRRGLETVLEAGEEGRGEEGDDGGAEEEEARLSHDVGSEILQL